MPTVRAEPHISTRFNGIAPAQIGNELFNPPVSGQAVDTMSMNEGKKKNITYNTVARLKGLWYADIAKSGLKHFIRFETDGTGQLRTQTQIDDIEPTFVPFQYEFDTETQTLTLKFLDLSGNDTNNPLLSQTLQRDAIDTERKIVLQAQSLSDVFVSDPKIASRLYEPTEQLVFASSPWPSQLFPSSVEFVGRFASILR